MYFVISSTVWILIKKIIYPIKRKTIDDRSINKKTSILAGDE